jgi:hypothetical protein
MACHSRVEDLDVGGIIDQIRELWLAVAGANR